VLKNKNDKVSYLQEEEDNTPDANTNMDCHR
jgi:hypothetical protein